jgi:predicted membrane-bound mannosyltransferase/DNA-binding beta-propeller fold protein YncE
MSTQEPTYGTTGERLKSFALNEAARDRLTAFAVRYWEIATYLAIGFSAAILRFWDLGSRAYHHDESLHGFYAWGFRNLVWQAATFGQWDPGTKLAEYHHVPFMHGPFQFIGSGFMMSIFGDGDYQGRLLAAFMGTGMVFLPFLLRRQLGTFGAIAASALIALSPTLIYYSRFTREDIYTGFWTLGIVCFMWRYLRSGDNKWLFLTAGFMAGSFATKETTFFTIGAFLVFLNYMFAVYLGDKIREQRAMSNVQYGAMVAGLNLVAWAIAIAWPFIDNWRAKYRLDAMPHEASMLLVMATLAMPSYAAAVQLLPFFGEEWQNRPWEGSNFHLHPAEAQVAYVTIFGLIGLSVLIGTLWNTRTWLLAAASFWVPYVLLYTTFFTNPEGFYSGIWGSLDYWMSQQDVARGNQPDYYYFITIPVYEFVPLALSVVAMLYYGIRGNLVRAGIVVAAVLAILFLLALPHGPEIQHVSLVHTWFPFLIVLALTMTLPMDIFNRFLIFWLVMTSLALTVASEKMPWLNVHIAIALCMLGGRFVGEILDRSDLREDLPRLERIAPFAYAALAAALSVVVFVMIGPFDAWSVVAWLMAVFAAVAVWWAFTGFSRKTAMQVAMVAAVAAFSVFSLRAGLLAAWGHPNNPYVGEDPNLAQRDHGEVPVELLVYTQTSGDIPKLRDRIDRLARESGLGHTLPIVVDSSDGYTWPWAWYLRNYRTVTWATVEPNYVPPQGAVLLINTNHVNNVQLGGGYETGIDYHHRRWFPETYRGKNGMYDTHDFFRDANPIGGRWGYWLDFWVRKTLPASEPGTTKGTAFFPVGSGVIDTAPVGPTVRTEGSQLVIGGAGSRDGQLNEPADIAVDAQGNIYVADQLNNRIQKYDANGVYQSVAGGITSDIRFDKPWSVAVASDGSVFVANTWNHQIVKLDSQLQQVDAWGEPCVDANALASGTCGEFELYGPRDITVAPNGNLLVADTGNNRIVEYTQDGDFVRTFGKKGKSGGPLELDEPVSVHANSAGDIFVADYWNSRIVVLDSSLNLKREIRIDSWGSTAVNERAYLWVLDDGRILATDPTTGRVLAFLPDGTPSGTYEVPKEGRQPVARPIGITSDGTSLLVADSAGGVVRKLPLTEIR